MNQNQINDATYEAIYWWNRDENYYHQYFSKFDSIYIDKDLLKFFTNKIFEVFLREYSIRRNISKGYENVDIFIDELFEFKFIENVKNGNQGIIDEVSDKIKIKNSSTTRHTKSLLSKIAFLVNPNAFYLYDTLAKNSIYDIYKQTKKFTRTDLDNYSFFAKQTNSLRQEITTNSFFNNSNEILNKFKNTDAYDFFLKNKDAFEMRITDKFLWLRQNQNGRELKNEKYTDLLRT